MKFLELNKKSHATKHFIDKPVDPKDVRTAIEIATLAPSAHNSQPWKFVVVRERNAELAKLAYGSNFEQVASAPATIALFTDTDLAKRARDCPCWWSKELLRRTTSVLYEKSSS